MIVFKEKQFTECDAMRSLYVELMKNGAQRGRWEIINKSQLIPILKGNNIVVEKFVISTSFFGRDKYRMYIKIGAKAKMPDEVRLPGSYYDEKLGGLSLKLKNKDLFGGGTSDNNNNNNNKKNNNNNNRNNNNRNNNYNQSNKSDYSDYDVRLFGNIETNLDNYYKIDIERHKLIGEAIKYDKKARELILEFDEIYDAIRALNILPFGLNYSIYLLDS